MIKKWISSSFGSLLLEEQYAFQLHHWELNTNGQHKCCSIGHNHNGHKVKCKEDVGVLRGVMSGAEVNDQHNRMHQIRAVRQTAQRDPIRG